MKELNFDLGQKTYKVNGHTEICFNPADVNFTSKVFDLVEKIAARQNDCAPEDTSEVFDVASKRDAEIREDIDAVFGENSAKNIFGDINVFSPSGGIPVCMHFLMAIIDEIDLAAGSSTTVSPEVNAYLKKYESKYGKYIKK